MTDPIETAALALEQKLAQGQALDDELLNDVTAPTLSNRARAQTYARANQRLEDEAARAIQKQAD